VFKQCKRCGYEWATRESFLTDRAINVIGYQAHFEELQLGLIFFNHKCRTTLTIHADQFCDLYDGIIFQKRATGSDQCPGYCLDTHELSPCPAQCECAYVREIVKIIKFWPKKLQE